MEAITKKAGAGNSLQTNLFEKEWSQSVRVLQTLLQLPEEETERHITEVTEAPILDRENSTVSTRLCVCAFPYILFVPVVDLMDVAKHNFVFSLHIIRDTLLLHSAHVALVMETHEGFTTGSRQSSQNSF